MCYLYHDYNEIETNTIMSNVIYNNKTIHIIKVKRIENSLIIKSSFLNTCKL